jgi:PKHD-type hydroxylase
LRFNTIFNHPSERTRVTYPFVWWDDAFTAEELDRIVEHCQAGATEKAGTLGGPNEKVRISSISWHKLNDDTDWLFRRLNDVIVAINSRWYGFTLNGYESVQYTEYHAEVSGKYDWHMDLCMGDSHLPAEMIEPRKLSLSLLLSEPGHDFQNGDFQFNLGNETGARTAECKKGRIVAFPSWMIHRVTPVTAGVRRSLVVWVTGPKFT